MGIRRKKTFMEQAADYVEQAVEQVRPHVEQAVDTAREKAGPVLTDAREKAGEAREKAGPVLTDARDRARPVIADGAALASAKAAVVAEAASAKAAEGRDLAAAKVAELKGEPPKKKGGKLKKLVLFGGLAGLAAFVASKLKSGQDSKNWQSSYTPTPPPAPPTPAPAPAATADDSAGSSPDEALADGTESAHPVSTPDDPADEVVLDEGDAKKD